MRANANDALIETSSRTGQDRTGEDSRGHGQFSTGGFQCTVLIPGIPFPVKEGGEHKKVATLQRK